MKAKLMSYNQIDLQSKAHMKMMIDDIEKAVEKYKKERGDETKTSPRRDSEKESRSRIHEV